MLHTSCAPCEEVYLGQAKMMDEMCFPASLICWCLITHVSAHFFKTISHGST